MELLDRYLQAVGKRLPWKRQDDIVAELRVNLESQLEDKEAQLGRPLTTREAEAWLRQLGSPAKMASRYLPQQYLIGPELFPTYLYMLRLTVFWMMVIYVIATVVRIFTGEIPDGVAVAGAVLRVPGILMTGAAWITLIFACIEFAARNSMAQQLGIVPRVDEWSPSSLPPLEKDLPPGTRRRSYANAVAEVVFGFLFLVWFLLVPEYPYLMFGPGAWYLRASPYQMAPVWMLAYWWIVALNFVQLAWNFVQLMRGQWQQPGLGQHIVYKAIGLIPVLVLALAPGQVLVLLRNPALDQVRYGGTLEGINQGIHKALLLLTAIIVLELVWNLGKKVIAVYRKRVVAGK